MRLMTIVITGCKQTPKWETLQEVLNQAIGEKGKLTRISRADNQVDYGAPGRYNLTFTTLNDDILIDMNIIN